MGILLNTSHPSLTVSADSLDIPFDQKFHVYLHVSELTYGSRHDRYSVSDKNGLMTLPEMLLPFEHSRLYSHSILQLSMNFGIVNSLSDEKLLEPTVYPLQINIPYYRLH
jgi:hypothetical protein